MPFQPTFLPAMVIAARRRRIIRTFEEAGADQPDRARTLEELGVRDSHLVSRMIRSGVLATPDGSRYHLSAEGIARWNQRRNVYVLAMVGVMTVVVLAVFLFARSR